MRIIGKQTGMMSDQQPSGGGNFRKELSQWLSILENVDFKIYIYHEIELSHSLEKRIDSDLPWMA